MGWKAFFAICFIWLLVCKTNADAWQVVSAQWRPDVNPWAKEQVWESTFWTEGWGYDEQFYPKYMKPAGSVHIILKNDSPSAETLTITHVNGRPLQELATSPRKVGDVVWYKLESPVPGSPDVGANRNDRRFERSDTAEVKPRRWAECSIRFRSVPEDNVVISFETGKSGTINVTVPIVAPRVRMEAVAFSPNIDTLYLYLRSMDGGSITKGRVMLDGRRVEAQWVPATRESDLVLVQVSLKPAWEYGSFHLIEIELGDKTRLARLVRAWDGYFCIGLYGVLEPQRVANAKANGFNTYFTGGVSRLLDDAGLNYVPAHNVGEGRSRTDKQSGVLFYQNKDEPDAHDWSAGEVLGPMDRLGVNAQAEVLPALNYQRARDPRTPNLLLVDNTYKPLQWYVYGQIADVYCTDPYVPLNGRQLDYVWQALDVARDACAPSPLVSVLWACSLDGKRKFGNNAPTPEEMRMMVFYALGSGVKGIAYFIDMSGKTGEGQFTGLSDIKPLWDEVGRCNRDVATLSTYLSIGCPIPKAVRTRQAWVRVLMCGPDKLVAIVVNPNHYIAFETRKETSLHKVATDIKLRIPLPPGFRNCMVQEVKDGELVPLSVKLKDDSVRLRLDALDTARAFVISRTD